eukprot:gnl/TRDRNA2_/TRDRNA2_125766_c0_seq1.p1 gnl/TRDRNA2_/TRDRNA2_125766_c0~~gnl/TRDRNA2_/TRDRNA2_125766_c0_seq1.p1  ORF type:complete len:196 (+),score=34.40 gnl/TRDRNA2_/TRDRNA2_125766_c0_seq1:69-656(+)
MAAEGTASEDEVLAKFAEKPAETDDDVKRLMAALLSKYRGMADSKWPTVLAEFNSRASEKKNKQSIKRLAEKVAKSSLTSSVGGAEEEAKLEKPEPEPSAAVHSGRLLSCEPVHCVQSPVHGWGVFASRKICQGETVHVTPFRQLDLTPAACPASVLKPDAEGIAVFQFIQACPRSKCRVQILPRDAAVLLLGTH